MSLHIVIGYGPAGAATARHLAERGCTVRVITRSGRPAGPGAGSAEPEAANAEPEIEHIALDATARGELTAAVRGATALYACAGTPYQHWARDFPPLAAALCAAAEESGALLVLLSNLYGYGPVDGELTEELPLAATGTKGRVRAEVWQRARELHEAGRIRAVEVRASDFFGPGVTDGGHLAARVVPRVLRGKPVTVLGDPDAPHSWTYLPDLARALAEVAGNEDAWGRAWHAPTAPARSAREMVGGLAEQAGVDTVPVRGMSGGTLRLLGLFSPLLRELREVSYQFDRPFVLDSGAYTDRFTVRATPAAEQFAQTADWWRERLAAPRRPT
ncbi:NAD-dependent epimerase/dehydratase family protein [Streptomyces boncukensis]|uniref:NAD-dependent epimerase/dehydratase family protein n=1 Tax=Streptomyces boncukensis TaxID=2711219 RepID=A0A6G4X8K2_9ACTN|nr:NAD-dependent epimerase/dehydratase family protein [Streptomyces boncukensis]NGO72991.1 NAD-dependent epimerase/dehydratase family protein [Streptomyces boncukensis]